MGLGNHGNHGKIKGQQKVQKACAESEDVWESKLGRSLRIVVYSGRIIVHLIPCFGNSYVLSVAYG